MIERVLAPNPGPFTGPGTTTYLLESRGEVVILDPGPIIDAHADAIVLALGSDTPVGVVVTHTHPDHAPLANPLARRLDVPVYGFGPGPAFTPDVTIGDGATVPFGVDEILAVHTPGHTSDHLCFRRGDVLFTGDHMMEGSTVIMEDASEYLDSLYLVRDLGVATLEPGHGSPMSKAGEVIDSIIAHRQQRERELVAAIDAGATTFGAIVDRVYAAVPSVLRDAALQQVHVQMSKLLRDGAVVFEAGTVEEQTEVRLR